MDVRSSKFYKINEKYLLAANALFDSYKDQSNMGFNLENFIYYYQTNISVDQIYKDYLRRALLYRSLAEIKELISNAKKAIELHIDDKIDANSKITEIKYISSFSSQVGISQAYNQGRLPPNNGNRIKILYFAGVYDYVLKMRETHPPGTKRAFKALETHRAKVFDKDRKNLGKKREQERNTQIALNAAAKWFENRNN